MDFPPRNLPELAPAYLAQPGFSPTEHDDTPDQQAYGLYSVDRASTFTLQTQLRKGPVATTQDDALLPFSLPTTLPGHSQHDEEFAGNTQSTEPLSLKGPSARPRKRKAPTRRAANWEPYKNRILDLHIAQKMPLPKVKQMIEQEFDFKAELRQYRTRISQWGEDKNVKPQEMEAIVRKRQKRKLVETNKGQLVFEVRGREVEPQKIERWMKRHDVVDSVLYAPNTAASTPSAVGCHTISERGSPAIISVHSPGGMYPPTQSPQMSPLAFSVSSIVKPQGSIFMGQSPTLAHRSLLVFESTSLASSSTSESEVCVSTRPRYRQDEEDHLRNQIFIAEITCIINPLEESRMLYKLGVVLIIQGRYKAAEDVIHKSAERSQSHNGSDDNTETLTTWYLLGDVLTRQGSYIKAEKLHRRVLKGMESVLGPEHPVTLRSMSQLADVLCIQGNYEEAEAMNNQTLALQKKVLWPEHPVTLQSMQSLVVSLRGQGKYKEAEVISRQTLALQEKVFGPEDPDTLLGRTYLATLLDYQGKHKEAEVMYRQILVIQERVLGPEHPDTLQSIYYLALALHSQCRFEEAEVMYRQTLVLQEKVLGPEHPETLFSMRNLARTLYRQGNYEEAELLNKSACERSKNVY